MSARWFVFLMTLMTALATASISGAQGDDAADDTPSPDAAGPAPLAESLTGIAKAEYQAGKVLFADADYENAIVKFNKAHELSGDPRLFWNIAICQKNLRQYSKMIVSVRRYRAEAEAMLGPDDREQADAIVKTVEGFISELTIEADQQAVEVFVDNEKVATTPFAEKVFVDVGRRTISVRKEGYKNFDKTIEVAGGGKVSVLARMVKDVHRGRLLVVAEEGSLIWVDGKAMGQTRWEGSLKSGAHSLKVTGEDMQPFQQDVTVEDGKTRRIDVELLPVPRDTTATILWIVGGVALAGATAVTSAFLFQSATTPPVEGSINPGSIQLTIGAW